MTIQTTHISCPASLRGFIARLLEAKVALDVQNANVDVARTQRQLAEAQTAMRNARAFLDRHEILGGSIDVALDAVGVVAGAAAFVALFSGATAAAGMLAVAGTVLAFGAGVASVALLAADGLMLGFEVFDYKAGSDWLNKTASYRWIEAVGPLILSPDLLVNFPRATRSVAKTGHELEKLVSEITTTREALGQARDVTGAFYGTEASRDQAWLDKLGVLRNRGGELAADLAKAQAKLKTAEWELKMAKYRDFPAWAGSTYGLSKYAVKPPELVEEWLGGQAADAPIATGLPSSRSFLANHAPPPGPTKSASPFDAWSLLVPDLPDRCLLASPQHLELRVAIARRPQPSGVAKDRSVARSATQFQNWDTAR